MSSTITYIEKRSQFQRTHMTPFSSFKDEVVGSKECVSDTLWQLTVMATTRSQTQWFKKWGKCSKINLCLKLQLHVYSLKSKVYVIIWNFPCSRDKRLGISTFFHLCFSTLFLYLNILVFFPQVAFFFTIFRAQYYVWQ